MKLLVRIFPLFFVMVGLGCLSLGVRNIVLAQKSSSWISTQGVILHSEVVSQRSAPPVHRRSSGRPTFGARVEYQYSALGREFRSSRVSFGDFSSGDVTHARSIVSKYPAGKAVTVYFDPHDPSLAVLETGITTSTYLLGGIGFVFFAGGSVLAFVTHANRERIDSAIDKAARRS